MSDCHKTITGTGLPVPAKITAVENASENGKKTLRFDRSFENMSPGNFCMVWIRDVDEIPLGCSYENGVTFQVVGEATEALARLSEGDGVGIRGPLGRPFTLPEKGEKILIIAGGIGAAPLAPLAEAAKAAGASVTTILGARSAADIVFEQRFAACGDVLLTTDDGSKGRKGFVTHVLAETDLSDISRIYVCGPEMMMKFTLDILIQKEAVDKAEFSMERYFKCGIGVCGACCIDTLGLRVCRDGPVFPARTLLDSEFGKYHRGPDGARKPY